MCRPNLLVAHINIRSLPPKFADLRSMILEEKYDVFGVTETWFSAKISNQSLKIDGYNLVRRYRLSRGGGVALYVSDKLRYKVETTDIGAA